MTKIVLFDLGGVLVRLGGVRALGEMIGQPDDDEVWRIWLGCPWVRRYERGLCSSGEFGAGMVERYDLPLSPDGFLETFRRWPLGLYQGAETLVGALRTRVRTGCLSNTNELHWSHERDSWGMGGLFDHVFVSHEMGLVKPDREAFEHVVDTLGCRAEEILFLDDNQINVDGARAVGLDAHRAVGLDAAQCLLVERDLLS